MWLIVLQGGKRNYSDCLGGSKRSTLGPTALWPGALPTWCLSPPMTSLPGLYSVQLCLISTLINWGLWGELLDSWTFWTLWERKWVRPTLSINLKNAFGSQPWEVVRTSLVGHSQPCGSGWTVGVICLNSGSERCIVFWEFKTNDKTWIKLILFF